MAIYTFSSEQTFGRKKLMLSSILLVVTLGLYGFHAYFFDTYKANAELAKNFRWYYLKAYTGAVSIRLQKAFSFTALVDKFSKNDRSATAETHGRSIPALLYHGVVADSDGGDINLERFYDHMLTLHKNGWRTITLQEFDRFIRGEIQLPDRSFLLTFDDARKDSYYPVDPILKALGYNAVMYVISGQSLRDESSYYLTTNELRRMIDSGRWEIESHGRDSHDNYKIDRDGTKGMFFANKLWLENEERLETREEYEERVMADLKNAKADLEKAFGKPILSFAFPFGNFGHTQSNFPEAKAILLEATKSIYSYAMHQTGADFGYTQNMAGDTSHMKRRFYMEEKWDGGDLLAAMENGREKTLPYSDTLNADRGWLYNWGRFTVESGALDIFGKDSQGSSGILDGSQFWENYTATADVEWVSGGSGAIITRFKNSDNYLFCNFATNGIRMIQRKDGIERVIRGSVAPIALEGRNFSIGMKVDGNRAQCLMNGIVVLDRASIEGAPAKGGVGFKTWDPEVNTSHLQITNLDVK